MGVVDCVWVKLLGQREPINNHDIGLAFTLHHGRDQLVHPAFEHPAHLRRESEGREEVTHPSVHSFIEQAKALKQ